MAVVKEKEDLVSIITAAYNAEQYLEETIKSVLNQTYKNWELIIVDDNSSDKTYEIASRYSQKDNRIKVVKLHKNLGPAAARNIAIKKSKGRYIAFLDSDDLWLPEKLILQTKFMKEKKLCFCYCSYRIIDESNNILGDFIVPTQITYTDLLKTNYIGCSTVVFDSFKLGKLFMPNILKRQDYGLWLKILKKIKVAYGIKEPLVLYRLRKKSVSSNKLIAAKYQWKIYRDLEKLSFFKSLYFFLHYAWHGICKYRKIKKS